jgi:hypothetical protein
MWRGVVYSGARQAQSRVGARGAEAPATMSDSSSDEDANLPPEVLERRQRAIQLLAKAMHKPSDAEGPNTSAASEDVDGEVRFLNSLIGSKPSEVMRCVRDRLSVLSVTKGGVQVSATKKPAPATKKPTTDDDDAAASATAADRLPDALRRLEAGDTSLVAAAVLTDAYWAAFIRERLDGPTARLLLDDSDEAASEPRLPLGAGAAAAVVASCVTVLGIGVAAGALRRPGRSPGAVPVALVAATAATAAICRASWSLLRRRRGLLCAPRSQEDELGVPDSQIRAMRSSLDVRGYGSLQPDGAAWDWGELAPTLSALRAAASAFRDAGWPPAFVFVLPGAWRLVDRLFAPMESLLGEGCQMDPSVFCWIAQQPEPAHASEHADRAGQLPRPPKPKAGANFGLPHRDFTCLQSLRKADGAPTLLSVWVPLTRVTTENGCMMAVPKQLDRHFFKRWAYAHMRPALPPDEDDDDGATEVRFDLSAARPIAPLPPGSIVAWVGNLIHWGTSCLPDADAPARTSVGFNFLRAGERLQSGAPALSRSDARVLTLEGRLALIARSLLAYSPWYALADTAVPPAFFPPRA